MSSWRDYPSAPPEGYLLCKLSDLHRGSSCLLVQSANGEFPLVIIRDDAGLRAFVNACPHQYLPLNFRSEKVLSDDGSRLLCSAHGACFDSQTGVGLTADVQGNALDEVPLEIAADGSVSVQLSV